MSKITFFIDDDQWRSAIVTGPNGTKRHPMVGDVIAVQLIVQLHDLAKWVPHRSKDTLRTQIFQIRDELSYFMGKVLDSNRIPFGERDDELNMKVLWEFLIDCGVQIDAIGIIPESDPSPLVVGEFSEGLAPLWGEIGFHGGHLLRPTSGAIDEIRELRPAPTSAGPETLRLFTLNTSQAGPAIIEPYKIDPMRRRGER